MAKEREKTGYETALERIAAAKGEQYLDLSGRGLTRLPPEIGSLTNLEVLLLSNNQLISLPPEIGSLTALTRLFLNSNQLKSLPPEIGSLTALTGLYLNSNQLKSLPPEIGSLTALTELYLHDNQLTSLPHEIGSLTALTELYLHDNQLTSLPVELNKLIKLRWLFLHGNDALKIPTEVLGRRVGSCKPWNPDGEEPAKPTDILNYYFGVRTAAAQGTLTAVNELKVMLVGRGGAGKTSLRRFFLGQSHDMDEPETPGIALDDFKMSCHGQTIQVRLWDFAGQEITHALHQFFLTEGCVYIVVLDPRSNTEMTDAFYWLNQLKRYAPNAPVLVALNRQDARQGGYDVDRDLLRERYPNIKAFVKTNCAKRDGCDDLRQLLSNVIAEFDVTQPPRQQVDERWLQVKEACWKMSSHRKVKPQEKSLIQSITGLFSQPPPEPIKRHTLKFDEFCAICDRHGIQERDKQESLARLLHLLGAVLHFGDDKRLRDMAVLNPHWVTDGVYRLLRYKDRPGSDGVLTIAEATDAVEDKSEESARYLLKLMERFEMCFPVDEDDHIPSRWLIPGALNPYQPEGLGQQWKRLGGVRLRYDYGAPVAEGIIPRFIVLTHPIKGDAVWRRGVVLRDGQAEAMIRLEEKSHYIEVVAYGTDADRLRLLELIQGTMNRVNADLPGKPPVVEQEVVGLPGETTGVYRSIAELKAAELANTPIVVASPGTSVTVEATPQLDRVSEPASRDVGRVPLRVFLSYSHENRRLKNRFVQNLSVMQGSNQISMWHDGLIEVGKDWKKEIDEQLEQMDLFIGLLTTSFLASSFIQKVELKAARERIRARDRRDFLFVLIVAEDNLSLNGLELAQYQLLKPGNKSIGQYPNHQAFLNQAQSDIQNLIKNHQFHLDGPHERHPEFADRTARTMQPTGSGVKIIQVAGNYYEGNPMIDRHDMHFHGNITNSQVGQTLTNCTNMIQQLASDEKKELLEALQRDVTLLIQSLPADKKDKEQEIADDLKMVVEQATGGMKNRKWYSVSAEGLLEAAKWVKNFTGEIAGTIGKLNKLLLGG